MSYEKKANTAIMGAKTPLSKASSLQKQIKMNKQYDKINQRRLQDLAYYIELSQDNKTRRRKQYDEVLASDFVKDRGFEIPSFDDLMDKKAMFKFNNVSYDLMDMRTMIKTQDMFNSGNLIDLMSPMKPKGDK